MISCPHCGSPLKKAGLTPRQKRVLDYISAFVAEHSHAPSFEEIRAGTGLGSKSNVHRIIHELRDRGHVAFTPAHSRSLVVL